MHIAPPNSSATWPKKPLKHGAYFRRKPAAEAGRQVAIEQLDFAKAKVVQFKARLKRVAKALKKTPKPKHR